MQDTASKPTVGQRLTMGAPLAVWMAAGFFLIYKLWNILMLTAVAALLAFTLRIGHHFILRWIPIRWISVTAMAAILGGCAVFLGLVIIPQTTSQIQDLFSKAPDYMESIKGKFHQWHQQIPFIPDFSLNSSGLKDFSKKTPDFFPALLKNAISISVELIAVLFLAFYMTTSPQLLRESILKVIPSHQKKRVNHFLENLQSRLQGWIIGTMIAMLVVGVGATLGLWLIGIPMPLAFGFFAGLLEVIPYVGATLGALLPAIVALTLSSTKTLLVLGYFLILNQIDGHIIQPLVMGQKVSLNPVFIVFSFLAMGKLFGFLGVLLAVPAAVFLSCVIDEWLVPHLKLPKKTDHP